MNRNGTAGGGRTRRGGKAYLWVVDLLADSHREMVAQRGPTRIRPLLKSSTPRGSRHRASRCDLGNIAHGTGRSLLARGKSAVFLLVISLLALGVPRSSKSTRGAGEARKPTGAPGTSQVCTRDAGRETAASRGPVRALEASQAKDAKGAASAGSAAQPQSPSAGRAAGAGGRGTETRSHIVAKSARVGSALPQTHHFMASTGRPLRGAALGRPPPTFGRPAPAIPLCLRRGEFGDARRGGSRFCGF